MIGRIWTMGYDIRLTPAYRQAYKSAQNSTAGTADFKPEISA